MLDYKSYNNYNNLQSGVVPKLIVHRKNRVSMEIVLIRVLTHIAVLMRYVELMGITEPDVIVPLLMKAIRL